MMSKEEYSAELYADLILANLQKQKKEENITKIQPKILVGLTQYIGGSDGWKDLAENITIVGGFSAKNKEKEECLIEFKKILEKYSDEDVSYLFLNLFLKTGWRHRENVKIHIEETPRKIDKKTIIEVVNSKDLYLDSIYIYFGKNSYEITSYAPFWFNYKPHIGPYYQIQVNKWQNTKENQKDLIYMLAKENKVGKKNNVGKT